MLLHKTSERGRWHFWVWPTNYHSRRWRLLRPDLLPLITLTRPSPTRPAARPQAFSVPVNGLRLTWHGRLGPVRRCQVAAATNKLSALAGVEASRGAFLASWPRPAARPSLPRNANEICSTCTEVIAECFRLSIYFPPKLSYFFLPANGPQMYETITQRTCQ